MYGERKQAERGWSQQAELPHCISNEAYFSNWDYGQIDSNSLFWIGKLQGKKNLVCTGNAQHIPLQNWGVRECWVIVHTVVIGAKYKIKTY